MDALDLILPFVTLAQDAPAGEGTPPPTLWNLLVTFAPFIFIGVFFYLILIAPQRRKQKEQQKMIAAADKGDRVTTIGGIMGTIVAVADDSVTIKVDESSNTKIRFQKSALASVEPKGKPAEAK